MKEFVDGTKILPEDADRWDSIESDEMAIYADHVFSIEQGGFSNVQDAQERLTLLGLVVESGSFDVYMRGNLNTDDWKVNGGTGQYIRFFDNVILFIDIVCPAPPSADGYTFTGAFSYFTKLPFLEDDNTVFKFGKFTSFANTGLVNTAVDGIVVQSNNVNYNAILRQWKSSNNASDNITGQILFPATASASTPVTLNGGVFYYNLYKGE